jgi:hypothetical protein
LDTLNVHRQGGYSVRERVMNAWDARFAAVGDAAALRHLSTEAEVELTLLARHAWHPHFGLPDDLWSALRQAETLDVLHKAPSPLLRGRDLRSLGVAPGREMGRLVKTAYLAQLDGEVTTLAQATAYIATVLQNEKGPSTASKEQ